MKNIIKKIFLSLIILFVFLCSYHTKVLADDSSYIYFDLSAGQVSISNSTYSGYIYKTTNETTETITITGTHNNTNKYYVYQSTAANRSTTGLVNDEFILPVYSEVMVEGKTWSEYITNNKDVLDVIDKWSSQTSGVRESTKNNILISVAGKTCDLTIDNIWSTYQSASNGLNGGGISINGANTKNTHVIVKIKGDNRLGNVRYYCSDYIGSSLTFTSHDGDNNTNGSLTVIGNQALTRSNGYYTTVEGNSYNIAENHWDSVIGGTDSYDRVYGLYIKGATIYAGATARENCTAIGGGGNGMGNVIISGGNVTAVSETTGTAIGGGIAHTSTGGTSDVQISGGNVYAYNFGQPARDVIKDFGTTNADIIEAASHIAGTAIGGASSIKSSGNQKDALVTISGGYVYAESLGGCAIGGGNSVTTTAGNAKINITGGTVIANSKGGTVTFSDNSTFIVNPGVSIGGGTGGINGDGGSATINISGGTIKTGSIGGGGTRNTNGTIGYAYIDISGGDISGQFIMVKGSDKACKFNMTNGIIHDSNTSDTDFVKLQENGGAVYMDDPKGVATISGGTIDNCTALNGGAIYMTAGILTLSDEGIISSCSASDLGGAIYLGKTGDIKGTFTMTGGSISGNSATEDGGAIYLDGGDATISGGTIDLNQAKNGGGAYLAGGTLNISNGIFKQNVATINGGGAYVSGGNINMTGGSFEENGALENGGGIYLTGGSLVMTAGSFTNNAAVKNGGGAYLSGGDFTLNGDNASFNGNYANNNGGGVFLTGGKPNLYKGSLIGNIAFNDGGGIYIDRQQVILAPTGDVIISQNKAGYDKDGLEGSELGRGAGIFIGGDEDTTASFSVDSQSTGFVLITQNKAKDFGGGVCINIGNFIVDKDNITVGKNSAKSGGGVAVLAGNFTLSAGTIGGVDLTNSADNGGGVYVSGGDALITNVGSIANNKAEINGGGVYVANGNVTMIGGLIDSNTASTGDGGGVYVSALGNNVNVRILSGSITNNTSSENGGAISVVGATEGSETITVTIGVDENHFDSDGNFISCEHGDAGYSSQTCPIVKGNEAQGKGGAVYITGGSQTYLNIYCLVEEDNASLDDKERSNFMMVEGGTIVISTRENNDTSKPATNGNSVISDSLHVKAGSLDIYGSMDNPLFEDSITVDITREEDHFGDHRTQTTDGTKYYKLQYFENFTEASGLVTGEYTVYQYKEGETITISGVVFSHPGYEIIGWFTDPNGGGTMYEVGEEYIFHEDLKIYAIWKSHSYYIEFDPNIPDGVTYEGSMEKILCTFNTPYDLPLNEYLYSGHIFTGWIDSKGNTYKNGQEILNLSGIDGDTIVLSAMWTTCDHDVNNENFTITYSYTAKDNILIKTCSCKGYSETITINANNYTYDGIAHPVTLKYSNNKWDEVVSLIYLKDSIEVESPINAGTYQARLAYNDAVAIATFIIYKADQEAPNKPSFTPEEINDEWNIVVSHSSEDPENKEYEYRLSYYADNEIIDLPWQDDNIFKLPITYTNYLIYIRYNSDENHNPSPEVRADQMYYYSTEVSIVIDCCDGFFCTLEENSTSGLNIIVTVLDGYYKSSEFNVTAETRIAGQTEQSTNKAQVSHDFKTLYDIPSDSSSDKYIITLIVRGAKKKASVTSYITENKVFGDVTTTTANISRDSAFTVYFNIKDYTEYNDLSINFNTELPSGSSIILVDKSNNSLWYINIASAVDVVTVSSFTQMGGTDKFAVSGSVLNYQFIVDFSKVQKGNEISSDLLEISLNAVGIRDDVPVFSSIYSPISVSLVSVSFDIKENDDPDTIEKEIEYIYADVTNDAESSKWDCRACAMIIDPIDELPSDSRIIITQGNTTTYYYQNENGLFIIPIKDLTLNNLKISLDSNLLADIEASYNVNIKLYASNSMVSRAVLNGDIVAEISNYVVFTTPAKSNAAIKITGDVHVVKVDGTLKVNISYVVPDNCVISSDLMVKTEEGDYTSSGSRPVINSQGDISISLAGLVEGSYCFRIIIKDSYGITVLSVPYYFIIINNSLTTS